MAAPQQRYSEKFKMQAIAIAKKAGVSSAATQLGLNSHYIRRWQKESEIDQALQFRETVRLRTLALDLDPQAVWNMDEVAVTFGQPNDFHGQEKLCFTVVLACSAAGNKTAPMIVFQGAPHPSVVQPSGIVVCYNKAGLCDESIMSEWLSRCWSRRPSYRTGMNLILLDSFRVHTLPTVVAGFRKRKTEVLIIPEGLSSDLQPMDVGVTHAVRESLQRSWESWIQQWDPELKADGRPHLATHAMVCEWVVGAWESVLPILAATCFFGALNGSGRGTETGNVGMDSGLCGDLILEVDSEDVDEITIDEEFETTSKISHCLDFANGEDEENAIGQHKNDPVGQEEYDIGHHEKDTNGFCEEEESNDDSYQLTSL